MILASRSIEKLKDIQAKLPHKSMAVEMGVSDSHRVSQAFKKIRDKYSRIDILVNAAGVMPLSYIKNRHHEEWLQTIDVNVKGVLCCINEVLCRI